jgi:enoyl-CoA hydratase/carnithine racemase
MTKRLLCDFALPEIARELELAATGSAQIRTREDFREGLASFLEKRKPRWGK